ncbi:hypothetical protein TRFO_30026 [Tritrichomonas foetus]|uniref:SPRY domain-containing protein n=1 Tax=Tritrichomonas foetus TaxID=1144522 RepID=A0A1J4JUF1_9EUKA|nr:hypothetical protein TRFO_30026 [Tritrichomonas foetus]|eukprot:OHT02769.1 hypothetical protein TRFO_30026 [Tritrichomonas foetus]
MAETPTRINDPLSPIIDGNCILNENGIATGKGDFSISTSVVNFDSSFCFSFAFIQISPDSKILFGVKGDPYSNFTLNYSEFLYLMRSSSIHPQIPNDGIGVSIRLLIFNQKLNIYINDVIYDNKYDVQSNNCQMFVNVINSANIPTILCTSFHKKENFQAFFPKKQNFFWNNGEKGIIERDFVISVSNSLQNNSLISDELLPLPGSNIVYFELNVLSVVSYESNEPIFKVGLTPNVIEKSPQTQSSLPYFHFPDSRLYFNKRDQNVQSKIGQGSIIGVGVDITNNIYFFIIDGKRFDANFTIKIHKHYYAMLQPFSFACQFYINLGQKPFKFCPVDLPKGWSIYYPDYPSIWHKGLPPDPHILNFFCPINFFKSGCHAIASSKQLSDPCEYEVTFFELDFSNFKEVLSVGFGPKDFLMNAMVGWNSACIGLHSDDGKIFNDSGFGENCCPDEFICAGTTLMVKIVNKSISFIIDKIHYDNKATFKDSLYPSLASKRGPIAIVNFGETPFFGVNDSLPEIGNSVKLFNKLVLNLDNEKLSEYGVEVNDIIESRDRRFRGKIAGSLKNRIYCYIDKYKGAFPLVETDPIDFKLVYKVIFSEKKQIVPILHLNLLGVDISKGNIDTLYATRVGLAFYLGTTQDGFVFRPLLDFYNNENVIVLQNMPTNILMHPTFGKINSVELQNDKFKFLDIVKFGNQPKLSLVLGKSELNNNIIGWDGNKFVQIPTNAKIRYEPFYSFGSRRKKGFICRSFTGLVEGGRKYPLNFTGYHGSIPHSKKNDCGSYFEAANVCKMHPILMHLCMTLNNTYEFETKTKTSSVNTNEVINDTELPFHYYQSSNETDEGFECSPLTTEIEFNEKEMLYIPV